ncbi:MAG: right-handed parallel beta-helix repeat-containing protein [Planctomycetes bacterium]|nr:right-handed parallel beta-helix repeat-containing protein [Planctomycetota bacterium]
MSKCSIALLALTIPQLLWAGERNAKTHSNFVTHPERSREIDDPTSPPDTPRGGLVRVVSCDGAFGYLTIQSAVNASSDGDTIIILSNDCSSDGRWHENVNLGTKSLRLQSADPADDEVVSATIIDAGLTGYGIRSSESGSIRPDVEIDGITLTGGDNAALFEGSNLLLNRSRIVESSATSLLRLSTNAILPTAVIRDCLFAMNGPGQVLRADQYDLTIERCRFVENISTIVNGQQSYMFYFTFTSLRLSDSVFSNNQAVNILLFWTGAVGGSIDRCEFASNRGMNFPVWIAVTTNQVTVSNSVFVGNQAHAFSGALKSTREILVQNCTFIGNMGGRAGAIYSHHASIRIKNCIIRGNRALHPFADEPNSDQVQQSLQRIEYCNIQDRASNLSATSIDVDPQFVDFGDWDDNGTPDIEDDFFVPGDYHLLPASPCIDAADPNLVPSGGESDIDGEARLMGCHVDIGADEAVRGSPYSGDFDGDFAVDLDDIRQFVESLVSGNASVCIADLNEDGVADGSDVQLFVDELL